MGEPDRLGLERLTRSGLNAPGSFFLGRRAIFADTTDRERWQIRMKRTVSRGRRNETKGTAGLPHLRFYHSVSLRTKTLSVLDELEESEDATGQREALAELVLELTKCGLAYYFMKPVEAAKVGFMAEQSTKLGLATIRRVMSPVVRRVIGGMDADQLLLVSQHIRHLME